MWRHRGASLGDPVNAKLLKTETNFNAAGPSLRPNARRVRREELMSRNKRRIDPAMVANMSFDGAAGHGRPPLRDMDAHRRTSFRAGEK